jgi:hypothetical protein
VEVTLPDGTEICKSCLGELQGRRYKYFLSQLLAGDGRETISNFTVFVFCAVAWPVAADLSAAREAIVVVVAAVVARQISCQFRACVLPSSVKPFSTFPLENILRTLEK